MSCEKKVICGIIGMLVMYAIAMFGMQLETWFGVGLFAIGVFGIVGIVSLSFKMIDKELDKKT